MVRGEEASVNRHDTEGLNIFQGGFLGLDNIGVFDRSAQLPTGGSLEQADGTAWMAFYCQSMLEMALILTGSNSTCLFFGWLTAKTVSAISATVDSSIRYVSHHSWVI